MKILITKHMLLLDRDAQHIVEMLLMVSYICLMGSYSSNWSKSNKDWH